MPDGGTLARLLVGAWKGGELFFVKKLKNGFSALTRRQVLESLEGLEIDECPSGGW